MVSEKSIGFGFGKFGLGRKVSVSVPENGIVKKVSLSVSVKILVLSFSAGNRDVEMANYQWQH